MWGCMRRYDEPGAWYAMLPLEVVYAFEPVPPPPSHQDMQPHAGAEEEAAALEEDLAGSTSDRQGSEDAQKWRCQGWAQH